MGGEGSTQSKHSRAHHKGETSSKTRTQSAYAKRIFKKESLVSWKDVFTCEEHSEIL